MAVKALEQTDLAKLKSSEEAVFGGYCDRHSCRGWCIRSKSSGEIASFVHLVPWGPYEYIACMGTLFEHRNKGYAKRLMNHVIRSNRGKVLMLRVESDNPRVLKWYQTLGFSISRKQDHQSPDPNVLTLLRFC